MRQTGIIYKEELSRLLKSPATYALLAFFYLISAAFMMVALVQASSEPQAENPFKTFWQMQWLANLVLVPMLTMRLLSAERKAGLLESVLATSTTPIEVVAGKFFAAYTLYLAAWASAPLYMAVVGFAGGLPASDAAYLFEPSALLGGGLFCIGSGVALVALGVFSSSLTRNGWLSGALTACVMLLFIMFPSMVSGMGSIPVLGNFNYLENLADFADGRVAISVLTSEGLAAVLMLVAGALAIERGAD